MRRGFTLVETAFSLALIGLVLLFVLNLYPSSLFAQHRAEERLTATRIARSLLDEQLVLPFNDLTVGLKRDLPVKKLDGIEYRSQLEVDKTSQADEKYLRVVRLTVRWQSHGKEFTVQRQVYKHKLAHNT